MAELSSGPVLVPDWQTTPEGIETLHEVFDLKATTSRRPTGIFDAPQHRFSPCCFKVALHGSDGAGKTALMALLAGKEAPTKYFATNGIHQQLVYWPAKVRATNTIVMFEMEVSDIGYQLGGSFPEFAETHCQGVGVDVYVFSFALPASWQKAITMVPQASQRPFVVVGTHADAKVEEAATDTSLLNFLAKHKQCVVEMDCMAEKQDRLGINRVMELLNTICTVALQNT